MFDETFLQRKLNTDESDQKKNQTHSLKIQIQILIFSYVRTCHSIP